MDTLHEEVRDPNPVLQPKADLPRRVLAFLIDSILAGVVGGILGFITPVLGALVNATYMILRDGTELDFMYRRSIGKRLMNLNVVRLDGGVVDLETSLRRNWMFGIGSLAQATFQFGLGTVVALVATGIVVYEIYRVVTDPAGRRWGDEMGRTQVVDAAA